MKQVYLLGQFTIKVMPYPINIVPVVPLILILGIAFTFKSRTP